MSDFSPTIAAAYATAGAAIDLGRGVHDGQTFTDAVVQAPLSMMNRHGLIAGDAKSLRATVGTYPKSEFYDLEVLLTSLGIGEAAITILSESGVPTPVVHTKLRPPASRMGPADDVEAAAKASPLYARYGTPVDSQSARELLAARVEQAAAPAQQPAQPAPQPAQPARQAQHREAAAAAAGGAAVIGGFLRSSVGKQIEREVVRGLFGLLKSRR